MNRQARHLDSWLSELGTARSAGILGQGGIARSFPWQSSAFKPAEPVRERFATATHAGWRRNLRSMAVAAVIGLVLVGVWRLERLLPTPTGNPQDSVSLASRDSKTAPAISGDQAKAVLEGDYNGDGKVDGDDIQALLNMKAQKATGGVELRDASDLTRRLLGS